MLPHGGHSGASLYLNMTDNGTAETGRGEKHKKIINNMITEMCFHSLRLSDFSIIVLGKSVSMLVFGSDSNINNYSWNFMKVSIVINGCSAPSHMLCIPIVVHNLPLVILGRISEILLTNENSKIM